MASFSVNFCRFFEDFISFSGVKWVWNWVKWIWVESRLRGSPAGAIKNNQNGFWKAKISKYFNFERIQKSPRRTQKAKRRHEFPKMTIGLMNHFLSVILIFEPSKMKVVQLNSGETADISEIFENSWRRKWSRGYWAYAEQGARGKNYNRQSDVNNLPFNDLRVVS